jgi:hypothetical protein
MNLSIKPGGPSKVLDRGKTVSKPFSLEALGLASSGKQIPKLLKILEV